MLTSDPLFDIVVFPEEADFQIKYIERNNPDRWHIKRHYHDLYELVLYDEFDGSVLLDGINRTVCRNKLLYLPPYAVHGFDLEPQKNVYIVLHLSPVFMNRTNSDFSMPMYPVLFDLEENGRMLFELFRCGRESLYSMRLREEAVRMILLWVAEQQTAPCAVFRRETNRFIELFEYISRTGDYRINMQKAAALCHMSQSSFCDNFRKCFDSSFNQFLQEKRIAEAGYLLRNTAKSCTEIAAELGFCDASHFTRIFKKISGNLPGELRSNLTDQQ